MDGHSGGNDTDFFLLWPRTYILGLIYLIWMHLQINCQTKDV